MAARPSALGKRAAAPRLASPAEQVVLEVPAQRARRGLAPARGAPIGLVGLADGGGRMIVPAELDVIADTDLEMTLAGRVQALCPSLNYDRSPESRMLVVGSDVTWRRRVSAPLEARGIKTAKASHVDEAVSVARRVPVRGIVANLLLPDPGVTVLLSRLQTAESMRRAPVLLVGPGALTPGQQRDLRRELAQWSRERPVPVSELAASVARTVHGFAPGDFDDVTIGESAWRAH